MDLVPQFDVNGMKMEVELYFMWEKKFMQIWHEKQPIRGPLHWVKFKKY